ncbi:MAG TPA: heavy metal sensor histidine kinase [Candidatus Limnocylindria bacterium]|nr:heavy metal sensor histidine kinase [Candidatus Limnocylindria bacterium]
MKPLSIRVHLTLWYSLILALSLSLFGGGAYFAMRHSIYSTLDAELRQRLEGIRGIISEDAPRGATALEDEFHEFAAGQGARGRLRVADAAGHILFASPGMEPINDRETNRKRSVGFNQKIAGERFRVLRDNLDIAGSLYDVTVATSTKELGEALERFRRVLFFAIPLLLLIAALGGYLMSRRALAPVDEITQSARRIGAQNLSVRLAVPQTGDELERLAATLNDMLSRLDAAFQRITQFTADASHELRTPVSIMRTCAELSLRKPRTESEYREALSQILAETEKVSRLIEQLLLLARADSGSATIPIARTNLNDVLQKAWRQASNLAASKNQKTEQHIPEAPVFVRGDPASLERLFLILLDNAMKYTPDSGRIELHLSTDDGFAVTEIRDTGIGIAAEDLPHIFDRFYRADRARSRETGGTGLGLAIGRWIVDAHGGEIRVQSEPAKGSSFQVRLPLSRD